MQINITATTDPADGFDRSELADQIIDALEVEPFIVGKVSVSLGDIAMSIGGEQEPDGQEG